MRRSASDFAAAGGSAAFDRDLPVGQMWFPPFERYEEAMRALVERRYYTNHGPLVRALESRLEASLGVSDVLTVCNATVGLYLVALALGLTGKVIVPGFTFVATAEAIVWAGLEPVFCDVDGKSHQVTPETLDAAIDRVLGGAGEAVTGAVPVNLWGGTCDPGAVVAWAMRRGVEVFFDSAQAFGCTVPGAATSEVHSGDPVPVGGSGRAEVFSFHATKIVSSGEGGCIATNDAELAETIRNMRSNYGIRSPRPVPLIINARMSEAQAAVAMLSLDDFEEHRLHNASVRAAYRDGLAGVPGFTVVEASAVSTSNHQYAVCDVDAEAFGMSRDHLRTVLRAEGILARRYFFPGAHRSEPFARRFPDALESLPVTDALCGRVLQLPVGALVSVDDAHRIAEVIAAAQACAGDLVARIGTA